MSYKVLIVDDEEMILRMLSLHFQAEGYQIYTAQTAQEALRKIAGKPDIILLDINMEGTNGLELCGLIRKHVNCPIIFLTARVTEEDKVLGLQLGGDDYITKPFSVSELMARVSAHIRREERSHRKTNGKFMDGLYIDYIERILYWNKKAIYFSKKEFEIISFLSMYAGQVFDRETIYERLWGFDKEGDSIVVKEHIRKIRAKLSQYTNRDYIETVWGVGYRWKK